MKKLSFYYKLFVRQLFSALGLAAFFGGLELTDHLVRLAHFDGKRWHFDAVRLDEGILERGKIKDRERFVACLSALKARIPGMAKKNKKIDVTVALGESAVYNQVFSLPFVEGKGFADAVRLNMQMASPVDISQVYSGWEISGRDLNLGRVDVLGEFSDRATIDEMTWALFEAGFVSSAIESKALSLVRAFRVEGAGLDPRASYLIVNIDDAGLDFLIVRGGKLYFEYGTPWRDLADAKGGITLEKFKETLTTNLRQIMNFFLQHWSGMIVGVAVTGGIFPDDTKRIAEEILSVPAFPLTLATQGGVGPEWFVAMGASLRNVGDKVQGDEVTLLGEGAQETFEKDKTLRFAEFWRFSMPVVFAVLVGLFALTEVFLLQEKNDVISKSVNAVSAAQKQEIVSLSAAATNFDRSVSFMESVQENQDPKYRMIGDIVQLATQNGVTIEQFSFTGYDNPVALTGLAQSQSQILALQTAIEADPRFGTVTLPLTGIQSSGGSYSFAMTFPAKKMTATSTAK
jgi:Tfp pilus assembly PilM family ATPase